MKNLTLKEVARMSGITMDEAISDICNCDLLYGKICSYHMKPDMKQTLSKWQEMSTDMDQYGLLSGTRFCQKENCKVKIKRK